MERRRSIVAKTVERLSRSWSTAERVSTELRAKPTGTEEVEREWRGREKIEGRDKEERDVFWRGVVQLARANGLVFSPQVELGT